MIRRMAVIPARGGSTRLKDKNILPLGGKPLICHTVEAVLASGCFSTIVVSTDSEKIIEAVEKYNVLLHKRPEKYATAKVTVLEAMLALMREVPKHDIFSYFLPTCPFRNAEDIQNGVELLTPDVDSVVSVVEFENPIQLAMIKNGDEYAPIYDNLSAGITNSKYIRKHYRPNGGFYISWWCSLEKNKNFFLGKIKGHLMPKHRSIDIDDAFDMYIAERMLEYETIKILE
jgi:CMP-N-acetylneuraminic acid synthetase